MRRLFLNKSVRDLLTRLSDLTFHIDRTPMPEREPVELRLENAWGMIDLSKLLYPRFCLPSADMDISAAIGSVVAHPSFAGGWASVASGASAPRLRGGTWAHITRMVYDATTANTQAVMGPDTTLANCAPLTLPGTGGYAAEMDLWIPPGWILGLTTTGNAGDNTRDITVWGEEVPMLAILDHPTNPVFLLGGYEWP